ADAAVGEACIEADLVLALALRLQVGVARVGQVHEAGPVYVHGEAVAREARVRGTDWRLVASVAERAAQPELVHEVADARVLVPVGRGQHVRAGQLGVQLPTLVRAERGRGIPPQRAREEQLV